MIGGSPVGGYPVGGYEQPETPASVDRILIGQAGSYVYSGGNAVILKNSILNALPGSYSYNGGQAVLSWSGEAFQSGDNYLIRVRRRGVR